jgi:hypothetical protein
LVVVGLAVGLPVGATVGTNDTPTRSTLTAERGRPR